MGSGFDVATPKKSKFPPGSASVGLMPEDKAPQIVTSDSMANSIPKLNRVAGWAIVAWAVCVPARGVFAPVAAAQPAASSTQGSEELPEPASARDLTVQSAVFTRTRSKVPPEARRAALAAAIEEVRKSGILDQAIQVGDQAIDFKLPESTGSNLRLSDMWAVGPVVVLFYRGGWCPYCGRYLHEMQRTLEEIQALDAQLVAISPELPEYTLAAQAKHKLAFPLLSDKGNTIARQYGIAYRIPAQVIPFYDESFDLQRSNGDDSYVLPLTATYVIDRGGVVRYAFVEPDYSERAAPKLVLEVLRNLQRKAFKQSPAGR